MVKHFFLVEHEAHPNRQTVNILAHVGGKAADIGQTGCVFLRRNNASRLGQRCIGGINALYVGWLERVMVGKGERSEVGDERTQVVNHLFRRGNACEKQDVVLLQTVERRMHVEKRFFAAPVRKERLQITVVDGGKKEILIGKKVQGLGNNAIFHRLKVFRTLRNDDDIGAVLARLGLAKPAGRKKAVVDDETVVVDKENVYARLDIAVLESIVKKHYVKAFVAFGETLYAMAAILVDGHGDSRKLLLHLKWLIADGCHGSVGSGNDIALALPLISTTENSDVESVLQKADKVFHVGRLACTADSDVAHRDDGHVKGMRLENSKFKGCIAQLYGKSVKPTEWKQCLVDLDEVALHAVKVNNSPALLPTLSQENMAGVPGWRSGG